MRRTTLLVLAAVVEAARQPTVVVVGATGTVGREHASVRTARAREGRGRLFFGTSSSIDRHTSFA